MNTVHVGEDFVDLFVDRLGGMLGRLVEELKVGQEHGNQRMLSPEQAAAKMLLHRDTVARWCREGRLPASKIGSKWLISSDDVEAYLRRHQMIHGRRAS